MRMRRLLLLLMVVGLAIPLMGQETTDEEKPINATKVDQLPTFKNSDLQKFRLWVIRHVTYPYALAKRRLAERYVYATSSPSRLHPMSPIRCVIPCNPQDNKKRVSKFGHPFYFNIQHPSIPKNQGSGPPHGVPLPLAYSRLVRS